MARYKVTGKVTKPELGVAGAVTATKLVDAASENEAIAKAKEKWQRSYGYILKKADEIKGIKATAV